MEATLKQVQQVIDSLTGPNGKRFFQPSRRGETYELKAELNADYRHIRKDAVKKVIANMTVGKDVSFLFADVVKNMQTEDLELKKLVYLYLINYAKTQPELVILAVNTFVKDSEDPNPLIRAMAIRTMGCLRVSRMTDYICEPLKKALSDSHPYVRKTAVLGVPKLFDLNPELTEENGFITILQDMLGDQNPMVVSNTVAALMEIAPHRKDAFSINSHLLNKLLVALNECTEWGQISILDALASYTPSGMTDAESVIEKVLPRFQHANPSVVMSALKVVILYCPHVSDPVAKNAKKKLCPPLISLLSTPPEVQYVAMKNIDLILQKNPGILEAEINVFFCQYNDPPYVKLAKLDLMLKLASVNNVDKLLAELIEYASEVDVDFVRRAVRAIGKVAIKIDEAADKCVTALLGLIKNKVNYVVQECIVVAKDIFRRYPNRFEAVIPALCENLDSLDEPDAKAAMIWIVGEYAQKIDNADELIQYFFENFKSEISSVQLQLVTASVKLFLKKPAKGHDLVQKVLQTATSSGESADLRDKAYIYWRLLSADPAVTKAVVLAEKPPIVLESTNLNPQLLGELLRQMSTVASVFHVPAKSFLLNDENGLGGGGKVGNVADDNESEDGGDTVNIPQTGGDLLDLDFSAPAVSPTGAPATKSGLVDLLGDLSPPKPGMAGVAFGNTATSPPGYGMNFMNTMQQPAPTNMGMPMNNSVTSTGPNYNINLADLNLGSPSPGQTHMSLGGGFGGAFSPPSGNVGSVFDSMPMGRTSPNNSTGSKPPSPKRASSPQKDPFDLLK